MSRRSDRDPWRAQRIRSLIGGVIAVIIVLGVLITLVVLMTAGMTSSGGSDAVGAPMVTNAAHTSTGR